MRRSPIPQFRPRALTAAIFAAATVTVPSISIAATWVTNGSGTWTSAANWSNANVPDVVGESAMFAGLFTADSTIALTSGVTLDALTFSGLNRSLTLGGTGASIALSGAAPSISMASNVFATQTVTADTSVFAPAGVTTIISNASFADLMLTGHFSLDGPTVVSATSLGEIHLATGAGAALSGGGTLTIQGTGVVRIGGTAVRSLGVTVSSGTLQIASFASINANPAAATTNITLNDNGRLLVDAPSSTVSNGNRRISLGSGGGILATSAMTRLNIANVISGAGGLTVDGTGIVSLSAANTYTGTTSINSGSLWIASSVPASGNGPLGSSNTAITIGDPNGVFNADLRVNLLNGQINRPITVREGSSAAGGTAILTYGGASNTGSVNATITLGDDLFVGAAGGTLALNGTITGSGGLKVQHFGTGYTGLATLNAHNDYFGRTLVYNDTLSVGAAVDVLPDFSDVLVYGANTTAGGAPAGRLDLNGFNETIGSLGDGGTAGGLVTLGSATLSVGRGGSDDRFRGIISGTGNVHKVGFGRQELGGANTYTGATTVTEGTLIASGNIAPSTNGPFGNSISAIVVGGAADFTPAGIGIGADGATISRPIVVKGPGFDLRSLSYEFENAVTPATVTSPITLENDVTFGARGGTLNINGAIAGPHDIYISNLGVGGQGVVGINGPVSFSGDLFVDSGTLKIGSTSTFASTVPSSAAIINADKLEFSGGSRHLTSLTGFGQTVVHGNGTISVVALDTGQLDVGTTTAGMVVLAGNASVGRVEQLNFGGTSEALTGKVDLLNNSMVIDYIEGEIDPIATLTVAAKVGRGSANSAGLYAYTGTGLTNSLINVDNATAGFNKYAVGVVSNAQLLELTETSYTAFAGLDVDASSVLVRTTYTGDANLDGRITAADYALINAAFAGAIPNVGWLTGDFNLDGSINADDYALLDFAALMNLDPLGGSSPTTVPEPAVGFVLTMGLFAASKRRRRASFSRGR